LTSSTININYSVSWFIFILHPSNFKSWLRPWRSPSGAAAGSPLLSILIIRSYGLSSFYTPLILNPGFVPDGLSPAPRWAGGKVDVMWGRGSTSLLGWEEAFAFCSALACGLDSTWIRSDDEAGRTGASVSCCCELPMSQGDGNGTMDSLRCHSVALPAGERTTSLPPSHITSLFEFLFVNI
jgi:hypothetical protein